MDEVRVPVAKAGEAVRRALVKAGLDEKDAGVVCAALMDAEVTGRRGHGLARVPGLVGRVAGHGSESIRIERDLASAVTIDGGGALGYLVAHRAALMACERLETQPLVAVGCRNTSHAGAIGYYARLVADRDHCALATAHCSPILAPHGGDRAVYGTNPMAFACPGPSHPLVADFSPAKITYGAMMNARHEGMPLPNGVAVDPRGRPTTDPEQALAGAVLPMGGPKGSALAFLVQVISGPLCGAAAVPELGEDYGFFLLGMRLDIFGDKETFREGVGRLVEAVRESNAACPGEGSETRRAENLEHGVGLSPALWERILAL